MRTVQKKTMKPKKKIICIANDVWKDSDELWGFNTFLKHGFDVEIWKVGEITIGTKIWEKTYFHINAVKIHSWKQLYFMLWRQNMRKTIFLFYSSESCLDKAKMMIKIFRGKYCVVNWAPAMNKTQLLQEKRIKGVPYHWMDVFPSSYNFLGTELHKGTLHSNYEATKANNIVIHTFNYEYYLLNEKAKIRIDDDYILFLDQNLISHKDQVNFGINNWISKPEVYIEELKKFLDYIEVYYQKPVIVAAHPTAALSINKIYGDRKIVFGQSCNYVKYAKFVIAFSSGSLDFAILYRKPVLFWNCDQLKKTYLYTEHQTPKVKKLHGKILNISKAYEGECIDDYLIGIDHFDEYMQYITANKGKELFFDIVVKYLKKI